MTTLYGKLSPAQYDALIQRAHRLRSEALHDHLGKLWRLIRRTGRRQPPVSMGGRPATGTY